MRRVGYKHPHCRYADWDSDAHPLDRQSLLWTARQPPSAVFPNKSLKRDPGLLRDLLAQMGPF